MNMTKTLNGTALTVAVEGRLDTVTAPELERELSNSLSGVTELTIDFARLDYISSAGLRALLAAFKIMRCQGSMRIANTNEIVKEVFEVTGFSNILPIE